MYQEFVKKVNRYSDIPTNITSKLAEIWRWATCFVEGYADEVTDPDTDTFDLPAFTYLLEDEFLELSVEYYDGYTYGDEIAFIFADVYCENDGCDFRLR